MPVIMQNDYFAPAIVPAHAAPAPLPTSPRRQGRRRLAAGLAVAGLVAAAATYWFAGRGPEFTNLALPESLAGAPRAAPERDFGRPGNGMDENSKEYGFQVVGRGYENPKGTPPRLLNLMVAAGDLSGKGDLSFAGTDERSFGKVTCTQSIKWGEDSAVHNPQQTLCWRTSDRLSVTALALATPDFLEQTAAAVDEVWALQTK